MKLLKINTLKLKNKYSIRKKHYKLKSRIKGTPDRPRLVVSRSNEYIYVQIIDDLNSKTLLSCSTLDRSIYYNYNSHKNCYISQKLGITLALKSLKKNITKIVFDRNGSLYHGKIKSIAEGARSGGLKF